MPYNINIQLEEGSLKVGDLVDTNCDTTNECRITKLYPVEILQQNNFSNHTLEIFTNSGTIVTWDLKKDGSIKIYYDNNSTVQYDGNWTMNDRFINIFDSNGKVILRTINKLYKTGGKMDFYPSGYGYGFISSIKVLPQVIDNQVVIKKTTQTKSYDENGNEVTDGSIKDDGYYQKGATPSYTRDDTKEVVIDNITGLMWQDDIEAKTVKKTWLTFVNSNTCSNNPSSLACIDTSGDTATTYCENLTLGGYTDWRIPTEKELVGIVNYGKSFPAIDNTFQNVNSENYWSSTTYKGFSSNAWIISFSSGYVNYDYKNSNNYIRCVRGRK
jgi:hypothetical protein